METAIANIRKSISQVNRMVSPSDPLDLICRQLELGFTPYRWSVHNNVDRIITRLAKRGTYQPHHEDILWDLSDSAKESL